MTGAMSHPAALFLLAALAAAHPAPEPQASPSAAPAPTYTPPPVIMPGPGIYRPNWETVDPKAPVPQPQASTGPAALPHYVGLGKVERDLAIRLRDLIALIDGHLDARRLASARVALERADAHVQAAEAEHLVLKLHADWSDPRARLLDLHDRYAAERRRGVDEESRRLAAQAAAKVGKRVEELARGFGKLNARDAAKRVDEARRALAEAQADPFMVDNPAWPPARDAVVVRLEKLEREVAVRVGQGQLLEQVLRMDALKRSADRRLGQHDWDGALGDLEALGEACLGFEHDLRELEGKGYDRGALSMVTAAGELRGAAFMNQVAAWRHEAERRWDVVERARARARIREEEELRPPDPPRLPGQ